MATKLRSSSIHVPSMMCTLATFIRRTGFAYSGISAVRGRGTSAAGAFRKAFGLDNDHIAWILKNGRHGRCVVMTCTACGAACGERAEDEP